jgi:DNA-binding response OmpR family regulator
MKKILLIEDNEDIRDNTAEILQLGNYEVLVAENGKTGMEKAIQHKPDLIICDIMMPFLDGYGVLHAIHRNEELKNIPFIFLTAKTERSDFRKGMELGADDYITKPFTGTELLNAVDSRLKKISSMKEEFSRMEELQYLMKNTLGQDDYELFAEGRNVNKYTKKQLIYSEGDRPYYLFYIIKGKVKTFKSNDYGKELVTEICSEGDFIGYVPLLEDTLYKDSAAPLETCEIAMIPRNDFEQMINNNKEIAHRFIRLLAKILPKKKTN